MNVLNAQTMFGKLLRLAPDDRAVDLELWDAELGIWLTLAVALRQEQAMAQGIPVLRGPYIVDYTDIPHDGDKKTLWTPQVGDILLRLVTDGSAEVPWDHGQIVIGPNVDGTGTTQQNIIGDAVDFNAGAGPWSQWRAADPAFDGTYYDASGRQVRSTVYVFHTTDPVQIQLVQTSGTDPGAGHVEIYALVARALVP